VHAFGGEGEVDPGVDGGLGQLAGEVSGVRADPHPALAGAYLGGQVGHRPAQQVRRVRAHVLPRCRRRARA
jgi:hypothetical protein